MVRVFREDVLRESFVKNFVGKQFRNITGRQIMGKRETTLFLHILEKLSNPF